MDGMRPPLPSSSRIFQRWKFCLLGVSLSLGLSLVLAFAGGEPQAASWDDKPASCEEQETALGKELAQQVQAKIPRLYDLAIRWASTSWPPACS